MQQQQQQMAGNGGPVNPTHVTTEQIQQCLDENKQLILMIMEYQNVGKFAECAPFQAQLQKNLTYLAQIADTQQPGGGGGGQPTPSPVSTQPQTQTGHFLQHSQAPVSQQRQQQQSPFAASKLPFHLNDQQQQQQPSFR